ncbi:uncharacterized protein AMSG_11764 [Thecamonas trahens ATCC 50062]|uniref:Protein kinase domain-containing protein n=1 Tax=Thecamonas trahens ATCC 50062 TaxID=461836 RepID=A0A0L0D3T9_THETB|nr:hypothetical protein AMSG_11764 [Thecamonas trahens ATCC 50062]KNC46979.1 hypothetical protein AMSG_11764 [Thecamonas trahens ATCC 50062]|eukprot:XP_013760262.1 hypothetical protein AMSG_11764 [Thecamonas trahens ATCC 50062]
MWVSPELAVGPSGSGAFSAAATSGNATWCTVARGIAADGSDRLRCGGSIALEFDVETTAAFSARAAVVPAGGFGTEMLVSITLAGGERRSWIRDVSAPGATAPEHETAAPLIDILPHCLLLPAGKVMIELGLTAPGMAVEAVTLSTLMLAPVLERVVGCEERMDGTSPVCPTGPGTSIAVHGARLCADAGAVVVKFGGSSATVIAVAEDGMSAEIQLPTVAYGPTTLMAMVNDGIGHLTLLPGLPLIVAASLSRSSSRVVVAMEGHRLGRGVVDDSQAWLRLASGVEEACANVTGGTPSLESATSRLECWTNEASAVATIGVRVAVGSASSPVRWFGPNERLRRKAKCVLTGCAHGGRCDVATGACRCSWPWLGASCRNDGRYLVVIPILAIWTVSLLAFGLVRIAGWIGDRSHRRNVSAYSTTMGEMSDGAMMASTIAVSLDDLDVVRTVGQGSCGKVYVALWRGSEVAVKRFFVSMPSATVKTEFASESMIKFHVRHPNLVALIGASAEPERVALVLEYVANGALFDILGKKTIALLWERRLLWASQLAAAMAFLHTSRVAHGALSSFNVLLSASWDIKVSDFGFVATKKASAAAAASPLPIAGEDWMAQQCDMSVPGQPALSGTQTNGSMARSESATAVSLRGLQRQPAKRKRRWTFFRVVPDESVPETTIHNAFWSAPEALLGDVSDPYAVDVYALGVVLWELLSRRPLYAGMHPLTVVRNVLDVELRPSTSSLPPDANGTPPAPFHKEVVPKSGFLFSVSVGVCNAAAFYEQAASEVAEFDTQLLHLRSALAAATKAHSGFSTSADALLYTSVFGSANDALEFLADVATLTSELITVGDGTDLAKRGLKLGSSQAVNSTELGPQLSSQLGSDILSRGNITAMSALSPSYPSAGTMMQSNDILSSASAHRFRT